MPISTKPSNVGPANAEETTKALRWLARETEFLFAAEQLNAAADYIESIPTVDDAMRAEWQKTADELDRMRGQVAYEGFNDLATMIAKYKTVMLAANEISIADDEERERLEARLKESQRRERAAVEDIADMEKSLPFGVGCYYCRHYTPAGGDGECSDGCNFEWRGPQEAGEELT